jgi:hypothetical protein
MAHGWTKTKVEAPAEPSGVEGFHGAEADLMGRQRQPKDVDPHDLAEHGWLADFSEQEREALKLLASLFVGPRPPVTDPRYALPAPFGSSPDRPITKASPVKQAKADSWSAAAVQVGAGVVTLVPRNPHRESLRILNRGATALLVAPTRDQADGENAFAIEAGAPPFELAQLGPVYARSETGAVLDVRVLQTYFGETI